MLKLLVTLLLIGMFSVPAQSQGLVTNRAKLASQSSFEDPENKFNARSAEEADDTYEYNGYFIHTNVAGYRSDVGRSKCYIISHQFIICFSFLNFSVIKRICMINEVCKSQYDNLFECYCQRKYCTAGLKDAGARCQKTLRTNIWVQVKPAPGNVMSRILF